MNRVFSISVALLASAAITGTTTVAEAAGKSLPPSAAVSKVTMGPCSAYLPDGWTLSTDDRGSAADAFSADHRYWSSWGMMGVNPAMQPYYANYGVDRDFYSPVPAKQAMATIRMAAKNLGYSTSISKVGRTITKGIYKASKVKSPNAVGFVIWADKPFPGDGVNFAYISAFRGTMAPRGTSDNELLRMVRNGLSIRCTTQLVASPEPFKPTSGFPSFPKSTASTSGYNAQLDTFWAHDPSTGQNYSLTNSDLVTTGCGSGNKVAVKVVGNNCVELAPGRSD